MMGPNPTSMGPYFWAPIHGPESRSQIGARRKTDLNGLPQDLLLR